MIETNTVHRMMSQYTKYDALAAEEASSLKSNLEGTEDSSDEFSIEYSQMRRMNISQVVHYFCCCFLIRFNPWTLKALYLSPGEEQCLKKVHNYSSFLDEGLVKLNERRINGTLIGIEDVDANPYLQDRSPVIDQAWKALTEPQFIHVHASDLQKMGKDPTVSVKLPEELNYGSDAYVEELDILHKLHSLNLIRKDVNFNYYYGEKYSGISFANVTEIHRMHTNHCYYILLQILMCDANTDIVSYMWVESQDDPYPDFSINRKCGDLDILRDWRHSRRVATERFDALQNLRISRGL